LLFGRLGIRIICEGARVLVVLLGLPALAAVIVITPRDWGENVILPYFKPYGLGWIDKILV